jgi:hypothetical protein
MSEKIFIGSFESGVHHLTIPAPVIRKAEAALDADRQKRETEAQRAKLATLQAAKARGKLRRVMRMFLRRGR